MIGKQLKEIRQRKGYTQKEVADFLCISPQSISKWENGEATPSLEFLPKLSELFGCSIDEFFKNPYESDSNSTDIEKMLDFHKIFELKEGDEGYADPIQFAQKSGDWQKSSIRFVNSILKEKFITQQMIEARLSCDGTTAEKILTDFEKFKAVTKAPDSKYYVVNHEFLQAFIPMVKAAKIFSVLGKEKPASEALICEALDSLK